jgi:hypothetical protein
VLAYTPRSRHGAARRRRKEVAMSLYHVIGSELIPQGQVSRRQLDASRESLSLPLAGTEPIGTGKPLSIIVRHAYTGRFPKGSVFGGSRRDLLITSAVRDVFTTFNAAPRAVNIIKRRIAGKTNVKGIDATENGTPLVFYTPAVTMVSTTATIEMAFDDYPDELVSKIGGAIVSAGGIPLFGPYGPVLIGVGMAIKLVSTLVNSLSDSRTEFSVSERLEFELPDGAPIAAGHLVLCESSFDPTPFTFKLGTGLIDGNGQPYAGDEPYIVLLLDGKKRDAFKDFTPTAASAALLERFLQQKDGSELVIQSIVDAVKLYSDMRFRKEADKLSERLQGLDSASEEFAATKKKMDALIANIGEQLLKPSS